MLSQCYKYTLLLIIAFNSFILYSVVNVDYIFISPFIVYWCHRSLDWLKSYLSYLLPISFFILLWKISGTNLSEQESSYGKNHLLSDCLQRWLSLFYTVSLPWQKSLAFPVITYSVTPEDKVAISHVLSDCIIVCIEGSIKFPPRSARSILMPLKLKWFTYFFNQAAKRKHNYNSTSLNGKLIKPL